MKKYSTEQKILYVFLILAVLSLVLAVLPPINRNSVLGTSIFTFLFIGFGFLGTKFSYVKLSDDILLSRFLLFSHKEVNVMDILTIRYLPTWKFNSSLKSLFIDYKDRKWWPVELRNTMYSDITLGNIIYDLKKINPSIDVDDRALELLKKYEISLK